jgi:hypothetical protein
MNSYQSRRNTIYNNPGENLNSDFSTFKPKHASDVDFVRGDYQDTNVSRNIGNTTNILKHIGNLLKLCDAETEILIETINRINSIQRIDTRLPSYENYTKIMSKYSVENSQAISKIFSQIDNNSITQVFVLDFFINKYFKLIYEYNSFFQYYEYFMSTGQQKTILNELNKLFEGIEEKHQSFIHFNCNNFTKDDYKNSCKSLFTNPVFGELKNIIYNIVNEYNDLTNKLFRDKINGKIHGTTIGGYNKKTRRIVRKMKRVRKTKGTKRMGMRRTLKKV